MATGTFSHRHPVRALLRLEEAPKVISLGPCLELDLP